MKKFSVLIILLILFNTIFLLGQTIRNVPAQYATIQAGLNAAQSGDTVLVQPGTYKENIFWPNVNGIKLLAVGDTSDTFIDGRNLSSVIYISPTTIAIDSSTVIQGFSIMNGGNVSAGAGIFLKNANLIFNNISVFNNTASSRGGGIYSDSLGSAIITASTIRDNSAEFEGGGIYLLMPNRFLFQNVLICNNRNFHGSQTFDGGGGIYADRKNSSNNCKVLLHEVRIQHNSSHNNGGGIYALGISLEIYDSFIEDNTCENHGGGIFMQGGASVITHVEISRNVAIGSSGMGGGAFLSGISCIADELVMKDNVAGYMGGGLNSYYSSDVKVTRSFFEGNRARIGGALSLWRADLNHIVLSRNVATQGGGIWIEGNGYTNLSNLDFEGNVGDQGSCIYMGTNQVTIQNSSLISNKNLNNGAMIYRSNGNLTIHNSNFVTPAFGIFNNDNSSFVSAINNWWGDSSGPFHPIQNPFGLGDSVNAFVNVTPWLTIPDTSAPPIPVQNVKIASSGKDFISLTWDSSMIGDLKGYKVFYKTDSTGYPYDNSIDVGNATNYKITGLATGQKYYMAVIVYDLGGNESWYSNEVSTTTVPPLLVVASSANFPNRVLGDSSSIILSIISASSSALTLSSVTNNLSNFSHGITVPTIVNGNDTLKLKITFKPSTLGTVTDTLKITSDGGNASVILTGTSPYPVLVSSSASLSYGTVARKSTKQLGIKISNTSINKLTVDSIYTKTSIFTVDKNNGSVGTDTLSLNVTFSPTAVGAFTDTLYLRNNSETALVKIPLGGTTPSPQIVSAVNFVFFNTTVLKDSAVNNLIIRNTSITAAQISKVTVGSSFRITNDSLKTIAGKDSVILTLVYKPITYGTHSDTVKIESDGGNLNIPVDGSSPYPELLIPQSQVAFGSVGVYDSLKLQLYIKNKSINPLNIDSVYTNTISFAALLQKSNVTQTDSSQLIISFSTAKYGSSVDTVYFKSNAQVPLVKLPLSAFVPYPYLSVNKTLIDFGTVLKDSLKQLTVTLKDTSISRLSIDSILTKTKYFTATLTGTNKILTKKDSAIVLVEFKPDTVKQFVDTLYIFNSSQVNPFKIALSANGIISGINADAGLIPDHYSLSQNFPNPFNPSTVIRYALPFDSKVLIKIYNVLGQDVKLLKDEIISAGNYEVQFNSASLSSGVYFYRLSAESLDGKQKFSSIKKMILLK